MTPTPADDLRAALTAYAPLSEGHIQATGPNCFLLTATTDRDGYAGPETVTVDPRDGWSDEAACLGFCHLEAPRRGWHLEVHSDGYACGYPTREPFRSPNYLEREGGVWWPESLDDSRPAPAVSALKVLTLLALAAAPAPPTDTQNDAEA